MFWCAKEALAQAARELQAAQEAAQAQQAALEQLGSCMVEICEDIVNVMTNMMTVNGKFNASQCNQPINGAVEVYWSEDS